MGQRDPQDSGRKKEQKRILRRYLAVSAFCFVFFLIYDRFSHGIHSPWMTFLFAWPLCLGGLPAALQLAGILPSYTGTTGSGAEDAGDPGPVFSGRREDTEAPLPCPGDSTEDAGERGVKEGDRTEGWLDLCRFGIAALTVSSLLYGILDIAGTDSVYPGFLFSGGTALFVVGAGALAVSGAKRRKGR